jgi:hypothetical protein
MSTKLMVDKRSMRLALAMAVNAGWAASDSRKPEAERLAMPPADIEVCVDTVMDLCARMGFQSEMSAPNVSDLYGPDGQPIVTEH